MGSKRTVRGTAKPVEDLEPEPASGSDADFEDGPDDIDSDEDELFPVDGEIAEDSDEPEGSDDGADMEDEGTGLAGTCSLYFLYA